MKLKFKDFIYTIVLFVIAVIIMLYARSITDGFGALGIAIIAIMFAFMSVFSLIVVFLQYWFKWKMTWWMYLIETTVLFFLTYLVVLVLTRLY